MKRSFPLYHHKTGAVTSYFLDRREVTNVGWPRIFFCSKSMCSDMSYMYTRHPRVCQPTPANALVLDNTNVCQWGKGN
jgi:hypothetical protein